MEREVVILGSGPAGLTAAIYAARANLKPLMIHGPLAGGQLTTTTEVENYPGFVHGINGPELMDVMQKQAERFGTETIWGIATKVELSSDKKVVWVDDQKFETKALIISTGASAKTLGLNN